MPQDDEDVFFIDDDDGGTDSEGDVCECGCVRGNHEDGGAGRCAEHPGCRRFREMP